MDLSDHSPALLVGRLNGVDGIAIVLHEQHGRLSVTARRVNEEVVLAEQRLADANGSSFAVRLTGPFDNSAAFFAVTVRPVDGPMLSFHNTPI